MAKSEEIKTETIEVHEMNLFEKIQAVSNEVNNIEKNMQVGQGSYAYKAVSDLDVTLAVKKAETQFRIVSIPLKQDLVHQEIIKGVSKDNKETITHVDTIKMTVRIIDLDDPKSFIDVESFGKGIDPGDKGFGKASTYARKYALLNAYKIATGVDPDTTKSEELNVPKTVSEKKVLVLNYLNLNNAALQGALKMYNVTDINDLSEKQIEESYTMLKKKKYI